MRSRSLIVPSTALHVVGGEVEHSEREKYHISFEPYVPTTSSNPWKANRSQHSTMIDDPTNPTGQRIYKSLSHVNNYGIWIDLPLSYGFSPPTPKFFGALQGFICVAEAPPALTSENWDELVDALAKQVTEALSSKFLGAVFLKDLRKTVTMIRNPFGLITKTLVRKLPKGISAYTASHTKKYASMFLEYRYGWNPLYLDVCEFSKLIAHYATRGDLQRSLVTWSRLRAGKLFDPPSVSLETIYPFGGSDYLWESLANSPTPWRTKLSGQSGIIRLVPNEVKYAASVTCEQIRSNTETASLIGDILNVLQLGSWRQIRDTVWEVLPMSFVVDWFVTFGSIWRSQAAADLSRSDVRNVGYSIKSSRSFDVQVSCAFPRFLEYSDTIWAWPSSSVNSFVSGPGVLPATKYIGTPAQAYFQRTPGLPPGGDSVLKTGGLGILHSLDALSLFLQRLPKRT